MLVSAIILALYFWAYLANVENISSSLLVSDIAAIFAGVAFVTGFISYLWAPKNYLFASTLAAFILLSTAAAILLLNTGGYTSPFIALWMVVSIFAGVFGFYGLLPLFVATLGYMLLQYFVGGLTREAIVTIVLAGELPLVASYIIWHTKGKTDTSSDKAYRELATEFSQVSGKSDAIINAIGDGVISVNNRGVIQLINPAAQQIVGWGKQDAVSLDYKSVLKLIDKSDHELTTANDPVSQALATNKEVETNDLSLLTHSGKKLLVSVIVSPIGQAGSGAIIVFRDITKEKAEEREQAEFISTASHEMRTPVASIEGYLGLALNPQTAQVDPKAREYITKAHESAQHLGRLFQDLLDVSKAEDGRLSNNPKVVDVVAFTHEIVEGLRPKAEAKGLHFVFKPQPDDDEDQAGERRLNPVYYANVDNDHLHEILSNLVDNAIKYTPKGDVTVDIGGDADHVVISIADSGIGIPKEDQAHLFQKFYRVDNTETREIGGTGLGLYLSRRLIEAMNGRIWLESEYQRGSTFFVELPRLDHEEATRLIEAAGNEQIDESIDKATAPITQVVAPPVPPTITGLHQEPMVAAPAPASAGDSIYVTPPVEMVVQQLNASAAQAPIAPPQAAPTPPPVEQQYQTSAPPQYAPSTPRPPAATRPNIPLASIEQNPSQYVRQRPAAPIVPPRNQNQP